MDDEGKDRIITPKTQYFSLPTVPTDIMEELQTLKEEEVLNLIYGNEQIIDEQGYLTFLRSLPPQTRIYRGTDFKPDASYTLSEDWGFLVEKGISFADSDYSGKHDYPVLIETTIGEFVQYIESSLELINQIQGGVTESNFLGTGNTVEYVKNGVAGILNAIRTPEKELPMLPHRVYRVTDDQIAQRNKDLAGEK